MSTTTTAKATTVTSDAGSQSKGTESKALESKVSESKGGSWGSKESESNVSEPKVSDSKGAESKGLLTSIGSYAYSSASAVYGATSNVVKSHVPSFVGNTLSRAEASVGPFVTSATVDYALPLLVWADHKLVNPAYHKLLQTNAKFRELVNANSPTSQKLNELLPSNAVDAFWHHMTSSYERLTGGANKKEGEEEKEDELEKVKAFIADVKNKMGEAWDERLAEPARSFYDEMQASAKRYQNDRQQKQDRDNIQTQSLPDLVRTKLGQSWEKSVKQVYETAGAAQDKLASTAGAAKEKMESTAGAAKDKAVSTAGAAQEKAASTADTVKRNVEEFFKQAISLFHQKQQELQANLAEKAAQVQSSASDVAQKAESKEQSKEQELKEHYDKTIAELKQKMGKNWDDRLAEPALALFQQYTQSGDEQSRQQKADFVQRHSLYEITRMKLGQEWEKGVAAVYAAIAAAKQKVDEMSTASTTTTTSASSSSSSSPPSVSASTTISSTSSGMSPADMFYRTAVETYEKLKEKSKDGAVALNDFIDALKAKAGKWSDEMTSTAQRVFEALSSSTSSSSSSPSSSSSTSSSSTSKTAEK